MVGAIQHGSLLPRTHPSAGWALLSSGREGLVVALPVTAAQRGARGLVARHVVANLKVARYRQRLQLHVDAAVAIEKSDANAIPILLFAALSNDVTNLEPRLIHDVLP